MVFELSRLENKEHTQSYLERIAGAVVIRPVPEEKRTLVYTERNHRFVEYGLNHPFRSMLLSKQINEFKGEKVIFYPLKDINDSKSFDYLIENSSNSELVFCFDTRHVIKHPDNEQEFSFGNLKCKVIAKEYNPLKDDDSNALLKFLKKYVYRR